MRVFEVNHTTNGSTGRIMFGVADAVERNGGTVECAAPIVPMNRGKKTQRAFYHIGNYYSRMTANVISKVTGYLGCTANIATRNLLREIKKFKPDILHLHVLHGNYINLGLFFDYIKKNDIKVVWTLHDCSGFTGQCAHYQVDGCEKWKTGCYECPQIHLYPNTYVDKTKQMWAKKKKWFTGVNNLTLVTPSNWLKGEVEKSFLGEYPVKVINNGIDTAIFKPTESDFRKKYNLEGKKVILGVSFDWTKRKGIGTFAKLAERLPDDYKIVLVGVCNETINDVHEGIIAIEKTDDQQQLAEIYSAADVFVNPTLEDNYPTVNLEALACGTPVVTYKTGGSPEMITPLCGKVVEKGDIDGLEKAIYEATVTRRFKRENCAELGKTFSQKNRYNEYTELFNEILK